MTVTINGTTGIAGTNGSADTPAVQGEDTNTGIFFPAADTVAVATGGAERLRVDASGHLYPDTTAQTLGTSAKRWGTVFTTALSDGADQLVGSSSTTVRFGYGSAWTALAFATGGTERARIDASGNFAVGTTNSSTARATVAVPSSGTLQAALNVSNMVDADFQVRIANSLTQVGPSTATPLVFQTGQTERARIAASGRFSMSAGLTSTYGLTANTLNTIGGNIGATTPAWNNAQLEIVNSDAGTVAIALHRAGYSSNTLSVTDGNGIRIDGNIAIHAGNIGSYTGTDVLGQLNTTSGSTQTLSGLNLTPYKLVLIILNGISPSGTSIFLRLGLPTGENLAANLPTASSVWRGIVTIHLASGTYTSVASGGTYYASSAPVSNATTSLSLSVSSGSFDAGSATFLGVR